MRSAGALACAALLASSAAAAPASPRPAILMDAAFELRLPSGWSRKPGEMKMLVLVGPADADRVSALITARYYPPGDTAFPDMDAFLKRQTAPPLFEGSPKTETLPDLTVAGRKARHLARDASEFVPPSSMETREVPVREEVVALPAKTGFYVLTYRSPKSLHKKSRPAFQAVLKSFKPKA